MNKLNLLMKAVAALVVVLIFWGIFNREMMPFLTPFILIGTAAVLVLYVVDAFKTKNISKIATILAVAVFAVLVAYFKMFR